MDGGVRALQVIMGDTETCTGPSHPKPAHGCFRSTLRSPNQAASASPATVVALSLNLQDLLSQHSHSGCKLKGNSWDLGAFMCCRGEGILQHAAESWHSEDFGGRADAGSWGEICPSPSTGNAGPRMSWTGCQHPLGRREGGSPPPCLPCAPGGLQMEQQKETTQLLLEQSSTSTARTRGQSPAGAPQGAVQVESSSQILLVHQLQYHKATKGLEEA